MDPDDWQQPQQFRPERFLDESDNVIGRDRVIAFSLGTSTDHDIIGCSVMLPPLPAVIDFKRVVKLRYRNRVASHLVSETSYEPAVVKSVAFVAIP